MKTARNLSFFLNYSYCFRDFKKWISDEQTSAKIHRYHEVLSHCDSVRQHPHHWEHKTETGGNRYNARPDRGGVWMVIPACSPDLKPAEHLDQLWCAVCARATNTTTLADLQRWRRQQ